MTTITIDNPSVNSINIDVDLDDLLNQADNNDIIQYIVDNNCAEEILRELPEDDVVEYLTENVSMSTLIAGYSTRDAVDAICENTDATDLLDVLGTTTIAQWALNDGLDAFLQRCRDLDAEAVAQAIPSAAIKPVDAQLLDAFEIARGAIEAQIKLIDCMFPTHKPIAAQRLADAVAALSKHKEELTNVR